MAGGNMLGGIKIPQQGQQQSPYGWAPGASQNFSGTQSYPQLYGGPWNQLSQMIAGPHFNSNPYQQPYGTPAANGNSGNMAGQPGQSPQSFYGGGVGVNMPAFLNTMPIRGYTK